VGEPLKRISVIRFSLIEDVDANVTSYFSFDNLLFVRRTKYFRRTNISSELKFFIDS
jgi:hypothetical protein